MSRPSRIALPGIRARRATLTALVVASASAGLAIAPLGTAGAAAADRKHPITIAVTTDPALPQPGDGGAAYLAEVKKGVAAAAELWSDESDGNVEFSIETIRWVPGLGTCDGDRGPAREQVAKAVGFTGGPRKHLVVAVGNCPGGTATGSVTGGPDSGGAVYVPGLGSGATYSHELGHNLGFGHAGLLVCPAGTVDGSLTADSGENGDCKKSEYGDAWDVQGRSRAWMLKPLSSPNRIRLGWYGADRYRVVQGAGTDQQVTIRARDNESGLVAVQATDPGTGRTYYVELSRSADRDQGLEDTGGRVVDEEGTKFRRGYGVRILRYVGKSTSTVLVPTAAGRDGVRNEYWSPGEAFRTAGGGLRIEVVGNDGRQATLRITTGGGTGHPLRTAAASAAPGAQGGPTGTPTAGASASATAPDDDHGDPADTFIADPATSDDASAGQSAGPAARAATSDLAMTGTDLSIGVVGLVLLGGGTAVFLVSRNRRPHTRHRR